MKNWASTVDCILAVPVPPDTDTYTTIPHSVFLGEIKEELVNRGYEITQERYLTSDACQVITGTFKVKSDVDDEMAPALTFVNSYNKKRVASIRASALVLMCTNGMCGIVDNGSYSRKHTGNALEEFREHIQLVINGLDKEFERLVLNKEEMKHVSLTKSQKGQIVGDMLMEKMIAPVQLSELMREIRKSKYPGFRNDTLWAFYNHVTEALKDSHPMHYDKQHVAFHTYICDKFQLTGSRGLFDKLVLQDENVLLERIGRASVNEPNEFEIRENLLIEQNMNRLEDERHG